MNFAIPRIQFRSRLSPLFPIVHCMNTRATSRLSSRINAHLSSSKIISPNKMPRAISKFITHYQWSVHHKAGSGAVSMQNTVSARLIDIRWDLINTPSSNFVKANSIPFVIFIEDKLTPQGMVFQCETRRGSSYRYMINTVRCYSSHAERDSLVSYKGPKFESLEISLQEAMDEVLHSWGIDEEVMDFIEAANKYYNNSEYIQWLLNISDFISTNHD